MKKYYVYMYYDENEKCEIKTDLYTFEYKPVYIGKGKDKRLNHLSKFCKPNIKVKKVFENLNERQAHFIEAQLIGFIGIENLHNKKRGTNLYVLDYSEDNDIFEFIDLLGY